MAPPAGRRMQKPLADKPAGGEDFLDQTIAVWQPYSDRPLSREDAREIVENVSGFFRVLLEWVQEDRRANELPQASESLREARLPVIRNS